MANNSVLVGKYFLSFFVSILSCAMGGPVASTSELFRSGSNLFEGDILGIDKEAVRTGHSKHSAKNGILNSAMHWPEGTVPYIMAEGFKREEQMAIRAAMDHFSAVTCIQFVAKDNDYNYIRIQPSPANPWICGNSDVGMIGLGVQVISLTQGMDCFKPGVIQHELMHAVGFYHEQSRTDRDEFVDINESNLDNCDLKTNFQKYTNKEVSAFNFPYDFGSVMHYDKFAFAQDKTKWTIRPKPQYKDCEDLMGQRNGLSENDIGKINAMYNCPQQVRPPSGVNCRPVAKSAVLLPENPQPTTSTTTEAVPDEVETTDMETTTEEQTTPTIPEAITVARSRIRTTNRSTVKTTTETDSDVEPDTVDSQPSVDQQDNQLTDVKSCKNTMESGRNCANCTTKFANGSSRWYKRCWVPGQEDNDIQPDSALPPSATPDESSGTEPSIPATNQNCQITVESGQTCTLCTTMEGGRSHWTKQCRTGVNGNLRTRTAEPDNSGQPSLGPGQSCHDVFENGETCTYCSLGSRWNKHCWW